MMLQIGGRIAAAIRPVVATARGDWHRAVGGECIEIPSPTFTFYWGEHQMPSAFAAAAALAASPLTAESGR